MRAASDQEVFETHDGAHWTEFYMDYSITRQKRFFDHFIKEEAFDWDDLPSGQLQVRQPVGEFGQRKEVDWPIPRSNCTLQQLDAAAEPLGETTPAAGALMTYDDLGDGVTFTTDPPTRRSSPDRSQRSCSFPRMQRTPTNSSWSVPSKVR